MPNLTAALCNFGCNQLPTGFATELADNPQKDEAGPELAAEHSQIHVAGVQTLGEQPVANRGQHCVFTYIVGLEETPAGLASVRSSNGPYGFPAGRFRKCVSTKAQGGNRCDKANESAIASELALGKLLPACVVPAPVAMRPDASHDPTIQLVE